MRLKVQVSSLLGILLFIQGCVSTSLDFDEEIQAGRQEESIQLLESISWQGNSVHGYLADRIGFVINSDRMQLDLSKKEADENSITGSVTFLDRAEVEFGTAIAIDKRGYFLTAAHCIAAKQTVLLFWGQDEIEMREARVVWSRPGRNEELDLAVLHVDAKPHSVFEWRENAKVGDSVVSGGFQKEPKDPESNEIDIDTETRISAGKIEIVGQLRSPGGRFQSIAHDAPLVPGNSGGPVVGSDGKLIAINHTIQLVNGSNRNSGGRSVATRPDPEWVREIIQKDISKRMRE